MEKIVGILGGMGPEATSDLFQKVINLTQADKDQDHIQIIVENNITIPDRTLYILEKGENPLKYLIKSAIRLELMGANIIAMPCNTAHYFYDEITKYVDIQFINMIDEVAKFISHNPSLGTKIGLLATKGIYHTNIYKKSCAKYCIDVIYPSTQIQENILQLIYDIKSGKKDIDVLLVNKILKEFEKQNVFTLILGCTELPLVFNNIKLQGIEKFNFISSTDVLAQSIVELANGQVIKAENV